MIDGVSCPATSAEHGTSLPRQSQPRICHYIQRCYWFVISEPFHQAFKLNALQRRTTILATHSLGSESHRSRDYSGFRQCRKTPCPQHTNSCLPQLCPREQGFPSYFSQKSIFPSCSRLGIYYKQFNVHCFHYLPINR